MYRLWVIMLRNKTIRASPEAYDVSLSPSLSPEGKSVTDWQGKVYDISKSFPLGGDLEEATIWYNDTVIYPDTVRLNCYYYRHYSFWKDIEMIFVTVLGKKVMYAGEEI